MVIFTLPGGTLASMPVPRVDLEESAEASAPPAARDVGRPSPGSSPPRESVLVLSDRDQPRLAPEGREDPRVDPLPLVRVDVWAEIELPAIDGVDIVGVLRNDGPAAVRVACVGVELEAGGPGGPRRERRTAVPESVVIDAGAATRFRARFPAVGADRGRPRFAVYGAAREARHRCLAGA